MRRQAPRDHHRDRLLGAADERENEIFPDEQDLADGGAEDEREAGDGDGDEDLADDRQDEEDSDEEELEEELEPEEALASGRQDDAPDKAFSHRSGQAPVGQHAPVSSRQLKAKQRRKFKRLNKQQQSMEQQQQQRLPNLVAAKAPLLEASYQGRIRENERLVELKPKLRILNQLEVCDIELMLLGQNAESSKTNSNNNNNLPFIVSWIDRIQGEASLEARSEELMNCERQRNFTFKMRAIGCNGLESNE